MRSLLFASLLALFPHSASALSDKPNFILILVDDMGWADIAADGSRYYRTPHIDQLAAEGVRFTHGYAPSAVCSPSRAGILTGRNPARLHLTDYIPGEGNSSMGRLEIPEWTQSLDPALPNLPASLKAAGYTSASIGKWHLGGKGHMPLDCGFDVNIGGGDNGHPASFFWPYGRERAPGRVPGLAETGGQEGEYLTDRLTAEAIRFLRQNSTKPFFLYLSHYAVHAPLMAKPEDITAFESTPAADGQDFPTYAAMVKSVDDSVGRIVAELKELRVEDNTVLVFTSDNGGAVHFHATRNVPLRGGKGFPYEGGVREPFIVKAPGVAKPGLVSETPVTGTDLAPTFLELAHARSLPLADGNDITAALRGEPLTPRDLGWNYPHYWASSLITPNASLVSGGWKIIRWYEYDIAELYHLAEDPTEKTDLAKTDPQRLAEMQAKLDAWLKANDAQSATLKKDEPPAPPASANRATLANWR